MQPRYLAENSRPSLHASRDVWGVRKFGDGPLLKLIDEQQDSFTMFEDTLHHYLQQDEDMRSSHPRRGGEAIFRNFPSNP
jgi:hypothetical protein